MDLTGWGFRAEAGEKHVAGMWEGWGVHNTSAHMGVWGGLWGDAQGKAEGVASRTHVRWPQVGPGCLEQLLAVARRGGNVGALVISISS